MYNQYIEIILIYFEYVIIFIIMMMSIDTHTYIQTAYKVYTTIDIDLICGILVAE